MTQQLRLAGTAKEVSEPDQKAASPATAELRKRLVAGQVESDVRKEAPAPGGEQAYPPLHLHHDEDEAPLSTPTLIKQIEQTLDRMQDRLNKAREQVDDVLKFPSSPDEPWPPAAA